MNERIKNIIISRGSHQHSYIQVRHVHSTRLRVFKKLGGGRGGGWGEGDSQMYWSLETYHLFGARFSRRIRILGLNLEQYPDT